jgi:outer membrane immunogenic protein
MKKFLLGSVALVALGMGAPALAADMGVRPIAAAAPVSTWNGCYVGFYGGYAWGRSRHETGAGAVFAGPAGAVSVPGGFTLPAATLGPAAGPITDNFDVNGFIGGGTGGCQYQAGVWVIGIEGDGGVSNKDGQHFDLPPFGVGPFTNTFVSQTTERWTATARLRLGYAVDKWLLYVTGGGAWAGVEATTWFAGVPGAANIVAAGGVPSIHDKKTMFGYAVGAGMEYALGYGWSIKSEYLYMDFRSKDFFNPGVATVPNAFFVTPAQVRLYDHTFKWGLNYKFDWFAGKAPVAVVSK